MFLEVQLSKHVVSGMIDQLPEPVIIMMDCKTDNTLLRQKGAVVGINYHSEGAEPDEQWVSNTQLWDSD